MNEEEQKNLIHEMKEVFATKSDLVVFATKDDMKTIRSDFAVIREDHTNLEEQVDGIAEQTNEILKEVHELTARLHQIPTKDELIAAIHETYNLAKLQLEHDRIKKIIQDKLGVEV